MIRRFASRVKQNIHSEIQIIKCSKLSSFYIIVVFTCQSRLDLMFWEAEGHFNDFYIGTSLILSNIFLIINREMDLDQLDNMLDDDAGYVPTFNKAARPPTSKGLIRQQSIKSIEQNAISGYAPAPQKRTNMLQIHKQTARKEAISFEDFFKQQDKNQKDKISIKNNSATSQFVRGIVDDDQPIQRQRVMKPPLNKRIQDNKSSASVDKKQFLNNDSSTSVKKPEKNFGNDDFSPLGLIGKEQQKQTKKIMDDQVHYQQKFIENILKQERQSHKMEIQKLKRNYEEELKKKIELKDFQISKLKEFYQMQLKIKNERDSQSKDLSIMNRKIEDNLKLIEKMEYQIRNSNKKQSDQRKLEKQRAQQLFEQQKTEKLKEIQDLFSKLQLREREFRQQRNRSIENIEKEKKRLEENQSRVFKKESELENIYKRKEKQLTEEFQSKKGKIMEQQSNIRLERQLLEQDKQKLLYQRQELNLRIKKFEQSKRISMDELHIEKTKVLNKEIQISTKLNQIAIKENDVDLTQKDLINKLKLLELERKKIEIQRQTKPYPKGQVGFFSKTGDILQPKPQRQYEISNYQRSIKQMRDEYLKSISQI